MFDDALLESGKTHAFGAKRLSFPLAIGLHVAVIGAFVGASTWFTGEAPEPVIPILFPIASSPQPPPAGGGEERPRVNGAKTHPATRVAPPTFVPADSLAPVDTPTDLGDGGPFDETGGAGPSTGPGNGDGDGPPGVGPFGSGDSEDILRPGGDVRAPVLIQSIEPAYPEAARKARLEGTVILEAIIAAFGEVQEIRVLKSVHPLLDEAAERAVRQWRYRPATLNGRAVPVYLTVSVTFRINR